MCVITLCILRISQIVNFRLIFVSFYFLAKATNPLHREPDNEAVVAFCSAVDKEHDGAQISLRLLAHKIQSPIEKESLMALSVCILFFESINILSLKQSFSKGAFYIFKDTCNI